MTPLRPFFLMAAVILTYGQGPAGLAIGLLIIAVNELVALRTRVTAWDQDSLRLPGWLRWPFGRKRRKSFPTYDSVASDVSWATKSGRDFDLHVRRRFTRIARARLAELDVDLDDLADDPRRARALLGAELWQVIDPTREPSRARDSGGVSMAELHHLIDQLDAIGQADSSGGSRVATRAGA